MNFLCISHYNNDLNWLKEYQNPHVIYDKTWNGGLTDNDNSKETPPSNFIIITDDPNAAKRYIGNYPCQHFDIGMDFYIINQAKYSILSNSSFGWWASWLNTQSKLVIGPKYWARHNISDGYWSLGDQYVRGWYYMGRDGIMYDYDSCKSEAENYYKNKNIK